MEATAQRLSGRNPTAGSSSRFEFALFTAPLLLLLLAAAPARAAVRFDMFVGYDNIVPQGSWFPVTFEVFNDGEPFVGTIEVAPGNNPSVGQSRSMVVELPKGTTKRFIIPAYSPANGWNTYWSARLVDERGRERAIVQNTQLRIQDSSTPLAGAVSRTPPTLPEKTAPRNAPYQNQPRIARVQVLIFPDNPIALEGLDTVYLSSEKLFDMNVNQASALMAWLHRGGHLIVSVEQLNHFDGPGEWLKNALPAQITGLGAPPSHTAMHDWVTSRKRFDGRDYSFTGSTRVGRTVSANTYSNPYANLSKDDKFEETPLQTAALKLRDGQILIGNEAQPLVVTARRGRGQITQLAFAPELEPFKSWKHAPHFWAKMTDLPPEMLAENYTQQNRFGGRSIDGVFGAMVDSDQVRKLPVAWLLLLLVAYLAVIGPIDQYWLKKINKQMLTWITFPFYVAFFSALIYFIGYKLRAGESEWNELHVVDVVPHSNGQAADLRGWTFGSIYSPVNARYNVASAQRCATLRGESGGNYGSGNQESSKARVDTRGNTFVGVLDVPVWTSQLFISDWWDQQAAPLIVTVTDSEVTVENRLEKKLEQARLVVGNEIVELGEVPARKVQTFKRTSSTKTSLSSYVSRHGGNFLQALNARGRAFGDNTFSRLPDKHNATMAASFIEQINTPGANNYNNLSGPPGFDLSSLVQRGDAVFMAFVPDYTPVKPLNKFNPRRQSQNTLLRVAIEQKN